MAAVVPQLALIFRWPARRHRASPARASAIDLRDRVDKPTAISKVDRKISGPENLRARRRSARDHGRAHAGESRGAPDPGEDEQRPNISVQAGTDGRLHRTRAVAHALHVG